MATGENNGISPEYGQFSLHPLPYHLLYLAIADIHAR
jgi:hypothetical protein